MTASKALRGGWLESGQRIQYWPVDINHVPLDHFIVPAQPADYWIQHAGTLYTTLAEAEAAALGTYRVITYGPIQKETP